MLPAQNFELITTVLDKYFTFIMAHGNSYMTESIPEMMLDKTQEVGEYYSNWLAIPSTITPEEINELESYLGHQLPESYKYFIGQRHFVELYLGEYNIGFFRNLPQELVKAFEEAIEDSAGNMLEKNYLPFAYCSDSGLLCFDANSKVEGYDYPIVILEHGGDYDNPEFYAENFLEMFTEFNSHIEDWMKARRERG